MPGCGKWLGRWNGVHEHPGGATGTADPFFLDRTRILRLIDLSACAPFLDAQIRAIQPKIILALGRPATQTLLKTGRGIKAMRGQWQRLGDLPVMPTFHPAYLLRQARDKRLTFEDLKAVRQRYDELGGRR